MSGTLSFLSSEFSSALEYLKLLNSFVDSVGIVTPPFSSSSVLKSALGKHLAGGSTGLRLLDSVLHSPCVLGSQDWLRVCHSRTFSGSDVCLCGPHVSPTHSSPYWAVFWGQEIMMLPEAG